MPSSDITFCANQECPIKHKCRRGQTELVDDHPWVSMQSHSPDENGHCDEFWPMPGVYIRDPLLDDHM